MLRPRDQRGSGWNSRSALRWIDSRSREGMSRKSYRSTTSSRSARHSPRPTKSSKRLKGYGALPGTDGLGKTSFYLASVDAMSAFRPEAAAAQLTGCPTMFINGADDDTAPIETVGEVYRVLPGPKRWIIVPDADHNTLDTDPGLTAALADAVSWFGAYL